MRHLTLPRFWQRYRRLPREVQELADKSFDLLETEAPIQGTPVVSF
jgi:hypothetical protein